LWLANYLAGLNRTSGDLSPAEQASVKAGLDHHLGFWALFLLALLERAGQGELPSDADLHRLLHYADSSLSGFYRGLVDGAPEDVLIYWRLGEPRTDHCSRCPEIAAGSPYRKGELKQVPRDGQTPCLFNCYCDLYFGSPK
jgi:hypothetical protein